MKKIFIFAAAGFLFCLFSAGQAGAYSSNGYVLFGAYPICNGCLNGPEQQTEFDYIKSFMQSGGVYVNAQGWINYRDSHHWYDACQNYGTFVFSGLIGCQAQIGHGCDTASVNGFSWTGRPGDAPVCRWFGVAQECICNNESNYCSGQVFQDACGNWNCWGTKNCCSPSNSCAANTCVGQTCSDSCGNTYAGTKICAPSGSISGSNCVIPAGRTLCETNISWSTQNVSSAYVYNAAAGVISTQLNGTKRVTVNSTGSTYGLYQGGTNALLSSVSVRGTPTYAEPIGWHDLNDNNSCAAYGWAFDYDVSSASINVSAYKDGPAGSGTLIGVYAANTSRPDVNAAFGITGNHGFAINFDAASGLKDNNNHNIYIYAINQPAGENPKLLGSPKIIRCSAPPTPPPSILTVSLSSDKTGGNFPLNVNFTATVGGTAQGTINYRFDFNNDGNYNNDGTGSTFDAVSNTVQSASHTFTPGTHTVRVLAERGSLQAFSNIITITVSVPPCVPDCSCAAGVCSGQTCSNGCGGTCAGTNPCLPGWKEVAP